MEREGRRWADNGSVGGVGRSISCIQRCVCRTESELSTGFEMVYVLLACIYVLVYVHACRIRRLDTSMIESYKTYMHVPKKVDNVEVIMAECGKL